MNKTANTWCPEFPGFYGTIYEPQEDSEVEHINEIRREKGLDDAEWEEFDFDYDDYHQTVAVNFLAAVESELKEAGYVDSMEHEGISSPREYNFANDSIHCEVVFSPDNVKAIIKAISDDYECWREYLAEKYTSRSGFFSHYSNDPAEWDIKEDIEHSHKSGAILQFLVESLDLGDMPFYEEAAEGAYVSVKNYEELTERQ